MAEIVPKIQLLVFHQVNMLSCVLWGNSCSYISYYRNLYCHF